MEGRRALSAARGVGRDGLTLAAARAGAPGARVGRRITRAIKGAFVLVLAVGGVSVILAWTISASVREGRERSLEVQAIDRVHSVAHHFVADLHLALQGAPVSGHLTPEEVFRELTRRVEAYEALERAQGDEAAHRELGRLQDLKALLARLETSSLAAIGGSAAGRPATPPELSAINQLAHQVSTVVEELHAVHREKFERTVAGSHQRMLVISALYVAFGLGGGLLLLLGDRLLARDLVAPITRLADAAFRIAGGDLSRRVPVRSGDEIGQLSRAFNLMAERLEAHEAEQLTFEAALERQVKERTRELEAATARLRQTQAQLIRSERIAVTGQIAAGVTHEIRTPLNSLAINVQLLRRALSDDAVPPSPREVLETLSTVEYEITRINQILEEFVSFARLPAPRFAELEVGSLLQEILGLLRPQAAVAGVRVATLPTGTDFRVRGDQDQLRQVFLNLGQNALQAMPNGGVLGASVGRAGEWIEIAVTDTGPGIPEADREPIFHPFVSTKTNGLGLGLAIVRRIVEEHGGRVTCDNQAAGGAAFVVRLPEAVGEG